MLGIENRTGAHVRVCNIVERTWPNDYNIMQHPQMLFCWRFSRYSAPIHWLLHGHMTSSNKTVSRQTP